MSFDTWEYFKNNISFIYLEICWQEDDRVGDAEWRWGTYNVLELIDERKEEAPSPEEDYPSQEA